MARPAKILWPIGFVDLLRFMFPRKRPENRLKFYRLFLRDYIHLHSTIKASDEEIEERLRADKEKRFSENDAFHWRMWSGMSMDQWQREHRRARAQVMAAAKWEKFYKNRQKPS